MENTRSNKRTPISGARSPLGTLNASTPSKRLYTKQKALSKESVEASNDGRASVDKLSQWLANESSSKKQQHVVRSTVPSNATTPLRFRTKPKLKKEDVAATNDKRVSVKTLSSWMSDDPFEQKKLRHIRTGAKVIAKSRIFEPTQTKNIAMNIEKGSVRNKQAWLSNEAFKSESNSVAKRVLPSTEVRPYQTKKKKESPEKEFNSVKDKKEWLSNAFKDKNNHSNNKGEDILKSKSVGSEENKSFSANDELAIQKSASIDDDVVTLRSKVAEQPTVCQAEKKSAAGVDRTSVETVEADEDDTAVSVANRAKWLKAAFEKK
mmetsp:Transcript_28699/g.45194  ORF Transcript_28699/g.45194 Transcript_28699/m.45194 type:complete len:321 (+) Transcript_28699:44-1006(+)